MRSVSAALGSAHRSSAHRSSAHGSSAHGRSAASIFSSCQPYRRYHSWSVVDAVNALVVVNARGA